jgi:hypothetical protein
VSTSGGPQINGGSFHQHQRTSSASTHAYATDVIDPVKFAVEAVPSRGLAPDID